MAKKFSKDNIITAVVERLQNRIESKMDTIRYIIRVYKVSERTAYRYYDEASMLLPAVDVRVESRITPVELEVQPQLELLPRQEKAMQIKRVLTKLDRQVIASDIVRNTRFKPADRIKAMEYLSKLEGEFAPDRHIHLNTNADNAEMVRKINFNFIDGSDADDSIVDIIEE